MTQQNSQLGCLIKYQENKRCVEKFIIQYLFYQFSTKKEIYSQNLKSVINTAEETEIEIEMDQFDEELWEDINTSYEKIKDVREFIVDYLTNQIQDGDDLNTTEYLKCVLFLTTYFCNKEISDQLLSEHSPILEESLVFINYFKQSFDYLNQLYSEPQNIENNQHEINYEDDKFEQQTFSYLDDLISESYEKFLLTEIPKLPGLLQQQSQFMQDFKDCLEIIGQEKKVNKINYQQQHRFRQFFISLLSNESKSNLIKKHEIKGLKFFDKFTLFHVVCNSQIIETLEEDEAMLGFYFYASLNLMKNGYIYLNKEQKLIKFIEKLRTFKNLNQKEGYLFLMQLMKDQNEGKILTNYEDESGNQKLSDTFSLFKEWDSVNYKVSDHWVNKNQMQLYIDTIISAIKLILLPEFASSYRIDEKLPYQPTDMYIGYIQQCVRGKRLYLKYPDQLERHANYWESLTQNLYKSINEERQKRTKIRNTIYENQKIFEPSDEYICIKISQINYQMCLLKMSIANNSQNYDISNLINSIYSFIFLIDCSQYKDVCYQNQLYYALKSLFIEDDYILIILIQQIKKSFEFREYDYEGQSYKNFILSLKQEFPVNRYITRDGKRMFTLQQVERVFETLRVEFNRAREFFQVETNQIVVLNEKLKQFEKLLCKYGFLNQDKYQIFRKNIEIYIQYIKMEIELLENKKKVEYELVDNQIKSSQFVIRKVKLLGQNQTIILKSQPQKVIEHNNDQTLKKNERYQQTIKKEGKQIQDDLKKQLLREASILKVLPPHKNIIKFIDYQVSNQGTLDLFLEHCDEGSLADYINKHIKKNQVIPKKQKLNICKQILEGIQHLQKYNIIHSDLKLQNIVVQEVKNDIEVKIIDLGTSSFMVEKTLSYTKGFKSQDISESRYTDYFSLGMNFIRILFNPNFPSQYEDLRCHCNSELKNCGCLNKHCKKYLKAQLLNINKEYKTMYSEQLFQQIMNLFNDQPYLRPSLQVLIELFSSSSSSQLIPIRSWRLSRHNIKTNSMNSQLTNLLQTYIKINDDSEQNQCIKQTIDQEAQKLLDALDLDESKMDTLPQQENQNEVITKFQSNLEEYFIKQKGKEYQMRLITFIAEQNIDLRSFDFDIIQFIINSKSITIKDIIKLILKQKNIIPLILNALKEIVALDPNILQKVILTLLIEKDIQNIMIVCKDEIQQIADYFLTYVQ